MAGQSNFLDLIYDSALEPALWTPVMARFADMVGGAGGWLSQLSAEDGSGSSDDDPLSRLDHAWPRLYSQYARRNPLHNVDNPRDFMRRWTPSILTDEDWIAKDELTKTEFYNDLWRPQDIDAALMVRLAARGVEIATLNISRPRRRGQFSRADIEVAKRYHPHLIRAFGLGQRLAATRHLNGDLASVLDRSLHGLFVLADDGRVLHVNSAGEGFAAEPEGVRLVGGRLGAAIPTDARRLHALIGAAGAADDERRCGGSMPLATPSRRLPLSITVAPIRSERFAPFHTGHSILVCVTDLEAGVSLPDQRLRALFGLTPAETRVALAMFEGLNASEAAESFGVSVHTVRNQIARVHEKTGISRRSELVRLILRAVLG